mmetsp:Transcript_28684/g.72054  ORF Transcript_28684/g.72054 Transcript_28684/m.72054 type:complete len:299 (-) Transcript_28684:230-1126(-)
MCLSLLLQIGVAILKLRSRPRRCLFRWRGRRRAGKEALVLWDWSSKAPRCDGLIRIVIRVAIKVPAITILAINYPLHPNNDVHIVWPKQHVDVKVRWEQKLVRRQGALHVTERVSRLLMDGGWIHRNFFGVEDAILGRKCGWISRENLLAIPEGLKAVLPLAWANVFHDQFVLRDHAAFQSEAYHRSRVFEAVRVTKTALYRELRGLHQLVYSWLELIEGGALWTVEGHDMRIPQQSTSALRRSSQNLGQVFVVWLAEACFDTLFAIALRWVRLIRVDDAFTAISVIARLSTFIHGNA